MSPLFRAMAEIPEGTRFTTAGGRGGEFTLKIRDAGRGMGVEFFRPSGTSKPVSEQRCLEFWRLWTSGKRDLSDYRNQTGKHTKAAAACYVLPVFQWLSDRGR